MTNAIGRLDSICNALNQLARLSTKEGWPGALSAAAAKLSKDVELLAGAMDGAENNTAKLEALVNQANEHLPKDFAAFGQALAADLGRSLA